MSRGRWKSVKIPSSMFDKIKELIEEEKIIFNSIAAFVQSCIYKEISSLEIPVDRDEV